MGTASFRPGEGASARSREAHTGAGGRRARPGARLTRGGGRDRRLTGEGVPKIGVAGGPVGQVAHRVCRDLVHAATRGFDGSAAVNKALVARLLGTTPATLQRMLSPSEHLHFHAAHLLTLLAAEELVPEAARFKAMSELAAECGGYFVPYSAVPAGALGAAAAALQVGAAAGEAQRLVVEATSPASPGGPALTAEESAGIREAAAATARAAGELGQAAGG